MFVDFNQNAKDRTVASAYSVRATPDARVSTPLFWDEVADCWPEAFTIATVPQRLEQFGDPWEGMDDAAGGLESLLKLADRLGPAEKAPKGRAGSRCHSSRSPAQRPRTRRWLHYSNGGISTRPRPESWSLQTYSSTVCAVRARSGTGSGSTCNTSQKMPVHRRRHCWPITARGRLEPVRGSSGTTANAKLPTTLLIGANPVLNKVLVVTPSRLRLGHYLRFCKANDWPRQH